MSAPKTGRVASVEASTLATYQGAINALLETVDIAVWLLEHVADDGLAVGRDNQNEGMRAACFSTRDALMAHQRYIGIATLALFRGTEWPQVLPEVPK